MPSGTIDPVNLRAAIAWYVRARFACGRASARISGGAIGLTMLSGFNTNFRYRGVLFHVQTEDSGRGNPHVITHLFHGGNIIASTKQEYSALLVEKDLESAVKKLMEGQHKAILKQLSRGEHDRAIGERLGPDIFLLDKGRTSDSLESPAITQEDHPIAVPKTRPNASVSAAVVESKAPGSDRPAAASRGESSSGLARVFGDRVVSGKPLDEVVLDYLVESARRRRRPPK